VNLVPEFLSNTPFLIDLIALLDAGRKDFLDATRSMSRERIFANRLLKSFARKYPKS